MMQHVGPELANPTAHKLALLHHAERLADAETARLRRRPAVGTRAVRRTRRTQQGAVVRLLGLVGRWPEPSTHPGDTR